MLEGRRVYVVIPAYNEEKLIGRVLDTMPEWVDRMIAVDDASTDETPRMLCAAEARLGKRLRIVRHDRNRGVGAAIISGYEAALEELEGKDLVAVMAGDAQRDPADLPRLIEVSLASFAPITWQRAVDEKFGLLNGHDWQDRWRRRVEKALREQTILVLEAEGAVLGYACGTVDAALGLAHLDILAVDPAAQGRGAGRLLLREAERYFASRGATHLTLESLNTNVAANALYQAEGYCTLACHWNWFKKLDLTRL